MDDKKDFKKQRIKSYFLDATKEIIVNEGVENVTVRKVADITGYSYPTLYNYFTDLNELLWDVKRHMIKHDLVEVISRRLPKKLLDIKDIKKLFKVYIEYYLQNPNIFKFFYFYQLNRPDNRNKDTESEMDFDAMHKQTFQGFVADGTLQEKDVEAVSKIFIFAMHGMLMLYFSNEDNLTEHNVYEDLDKMVDYLLTN
ncbi:MAG: TetR/AcrR family transcriptional regulator [Bacillota bacterium]